MSTSSSIKKVFSAIAGVAFFAVGTVSAAPANAITFKFEGKLLDRILVEGSYTLDDAIFDRVINSPINTSANNAVLDFSLFLDGIEPDSSGIYSSVLYNYFEEPEFLLQVKTNKSADNDWPSNYTDLLEIAVKAPDGKPLSACKVMECEGRTVVGGKSGYYGNILNMPVKSVPEPSAAIALGIFGALMLVGKAKKRSDKSSIEPESPT